MDLKDYHQKSCFYKDLQEKTGVKMEVIRRKYKRDARIEPFLENKMR
jgi:hypothetical protein